MSAKQNLPVKIWAYAKSMKLAIALIVLVTAAVTVDILMLVKRWTPSAAGLGSQTGQIYRYWWFQVLVFLLMLNLLACTIDNAIRRLKARSGNISLWGSTIFHAGLIVILVGTLVTGNFRVFSTIKLIQGETKQIPYKALTTVSNSEQFQRDFSLTMLEQKTELNLKPDQKTETDLISQTNDTYSTIQMSDGAKNVVTRRLADQEEVFYKGIYLFPSRYGYALNLVITPPGANLTKRQAANVTVPMETHEYEDGIKAYTLNGYTNSLLPFGISYIFYPDLGKGASGSYLNRSNKLANPGLYVSVSETGKTLVEKIVRPGESIDVKGYRLTFNGAKPWTELTSVFDPGARIVFLGIFMAIAGLTVFSLFGSRKLTMAHSKGEPI